MYYGDQKALGHYYNRRYNELVRCLEFRLLNDYKLKSSKRINSHSVQEILENEYAKIRITLIKVGITFQDSLQIVRTRKPRKYNLLANEKIHSIDCTQEEGRKERQYFLLKEAEMHEEQISPLKHASNQEDSLKTKNNTPTISEGETMLKKPA
ncbi:hypothetical protein CWI38_1578p0010 [Hamiltosporidium tvaerminnensis]|uniref:Uncharacterized protein n=1 Tax=Hamiltosporidium tvaerminnensis TaxID=1176355 RepID=A0A4Q9LR56_9MICR|nr:hypothetical protein CWI38_1578p0010 [Hamiltosporidium tvaerminnensis]